jgi:Ca2+-binding EF-hand superfamily protein
MRSAFLFLAVALLLLPSLGGAGDPPASPSPGPVPGDEQDVVFFHETRPYRLRLHIQTDGRPFRTNWDGALRRLFEFLDADGDGVLSQVEAEHAPSLGQLQLLIRGIAALEPEPAPDYRDLAGAAGDKVALAAFKNFYRRAGAGPLQLEWGWRPPGAVDGWTDALFYYLDRDKDGKLSRAELEAAATVLGKLDLNDDEMISVTELASTRYSPDVGFRMQEGAEPPPTVVRCWTRSPDEDSGPLLRRLWELYDREKNQKLTRAEIGLEKEVFDRLDADGDGVLDAAEFARWLEQPADVEFIVQLGRPPDGQEAVTVWQPAGPPNRLGAAVRRSRQGSLLLPLPGTQVELLRGQGNSTRDTARNFYRRQFREADTDGDGVLDSKEVQRPPFTFVALLRVADRNGDGKLSAKELEAYLDLQERLAAQVPFLTLADRGSSLYELVDEDHDGRLGRRELRSAWARLAPWDADGDGCISRREVPHQYHLVVTPGDVRLAERPQTVLGYGPAAARPRERGPLWFRKMDRNGDGDVSRREWLGTSADFERIDRDGDGLIDATEAEQADRELRKKRP